MKTDDKFRRQVGERIRVLRLEAGYSQSELGRRASISTTGISAIEKGEHSPRLDNVEKLAKVFGLTITELVGR